MKSKLKEKQQFYINFRILANNQKFFMIESLHFKQIAFLNDGDHKNCRADDDRQRAQHL